MSKWRDDDIKDPKIGDEVALWRRGKATAAKVPITRVTPTLVEVEGAMYSRARGEERGKGGDGQRIAAWTAAIEEKNAAVIAEAQRRNRQEKLIAGLTFSMETIVRVKNAEGSYVKNRVLTEAELDALAPAAEALALAVKGIGPAISKY